MSDSRNPLSVPDLYRMKSAGEKIVALTAYDASFASLLDAAGVDLVLVGDSLGMVIQGGKTTLSVSIDDMIYHAKCVSLGVGRALIIVDLPFLTYTNPERAIDAAGRILRESGASMIKLEGGAKRCKVVRALADEDIPVCAHLGLLPQSVLRLGGYIVQGRGQLAAKSMIDDARRLEDAGASLLVLECIPAPLAAEISSAISMPTIGIGAGVDCDGQVLVSYDMLGITAHCPRFSGNFLEGVGNGGIQAAIESYVTAVRGRIFPGSEHSYL